VKAYVAKVKSSLKEYLPRREEVLSFAYKFFFETVKSLPELLKEVYLGASYVDGLRRVKREVKTKAAA